MAQAVARKVQNAKTTGHLSPDEAWTAICALSNDQRKGLVRIERRYRRGTDFAEGDLLHEAMAAAATGKNKCPRGTDVAAFVAQIIRGIAGRRRAKLQRHVPFDAAEGGAQSNLSSEPTPEETLIGREEEELTERDAAEALKIIFDALSYDEEASRVLRGLAEGKKGKALRDFAALDQAGLDYAIKRIQRVALKRFPEGWTQ